MSRTLPPQPLDGVKGRLFGIVTPVGVPRVLTRPNLRLPAHSRNFIGWLRAVNVRKGGHLAIAHCQAVLEDPHEMDDYASQEGAATLMGEMEWKHGKPCPTWLGPAVEQAKLQRRAYFADAEKLT